MAPPAVNPPGQRPGSSYLFIRDTQVGVALGGLGVGRRPWIQGEDGPVLCPQGHGGHGEQSVPLLVPLCCLITSLPPAGKGPAITIPYIKVDFLSASIS